MNRRSFLQLLSGLAATVTASSASLQAAPRTSRRVLVIGAGIGGLSCGYELKKRGHDVVVLEASDRPGGHVKTIHEPLADGLYADAGAEHITRPGYDILWEYIDELELTALPYPRRRNRLYYREGEFLSEEELNAPARLRQQGFSEREIEYMRRHPESSVRMLYFEPYLDAFEDEYDPFAAGLDHLDRMTVSEFLQSENASPGAVEHAGGSSSALLDLWEAAILRLRGVPSSPVDLWRIQGGNQRITDALADALGDRLRLHSEVTSIENGQDSVAVTLRDETDREETLTGDYAVWAAPLSMLVRIDVSPSWSAAKRHVIRNTTYTTESRVVMQTRTRFWDADGVSPNLVFGRSPLTHVWAMAEEVDTERGILVGDAEGVTTPDQAASVFRELYPGRSEDIEYTHVIAWPMDQWAASCNRGSFPVGSLDAFWPEIMRPEGRIHFAGSSFDNLNWGMEAATRSARRVAHMISTS